MVFLEPFPAFAKSFLVPGIFSNQKGAFVGRSFCLQK
jgi:hypothetical protein